MTKNGHVKSKTLGRLIFGEKRKQHVSPGRTSVCPVPSLLGKNLIDIHDWAIWRMQLNEQMSSILLSEQRNDMKQMRQYLQSNSFYRKHSRNSSDRRHNAIRLLFSIPRAIFKAELLNENLETNVCEQNDDERTTSVTSVSALQLPMVPEKSVNQLYSKDYIGNTDGVFVQVNEQMLAVNGIRSRRSRRNSFKAPDRLHSTLEKAVKDGNVLEKIKAFEMQAAAAAAQAESVMKSSTLNHRAQTMSSITHRTLSPLVIHPISSIRSHHIHPIQYPQHNTYESIMNNELLEPVHDDVILKHQAPSEKTLPDEDYSLTAINSKTKTASQDSHRHHRRHRRHHHHHHQTGTSRSKHRQEKIYDTHKSSSKSNKSSSRRRWLKGRKHTSTEGDNLPEKSSKISKSKVNPSDNNRVYGVPKSDLNEQLKNDSIILQPPTIDQSDRNLSNKKLSIQRRTSKKHQSFETNETNKNTDLFIENTSTIVRHQSIINISRTNSHRSQTKTSATIRRYASQYSTDEHIQSTSNRINQDEQNLYEIPHSDQEQQQEANNHQLKKMRPFHTMSTTGNSNNRKQISKQILHAIMNSMNNKDSSKVNETFFENGPHTNPDEIIANLKAIEKLN